jgi:hypothetical protein
MKPDTQSLSLSGYGDEPPSPAARRRDRFREISGHLISDVSFFGPWRPHSGIERLRVGMAFHGETQSGLLPPAQTKAAAPKNRRFVA